MKILVIQQKMIGDVLTSTIICESLKEKYPASEVVYLVNTSTIPVLKENPSFDRIIEFKNENRDSKFAFIKFLIKIRNEKFDLVVDAYGKLESNLISLFSNSREKVSFYKKYTHWIYTKTIPRVASPITNASTAIENRLRLVYSESELVQNIKRPKIYLTTDEKEAAKRLLVTHKISSNEPLFMISVLGSEDIKTLPFSYMAMLLDEIVKTTDGSIVFNYIPSQKEAARSIYNLTQPETQRKIYFDVFGKSLREFMAILSQCTALIGNEGGAVNIAKALDKPTFTIFSPWIIKKDWNMFEDGKMHDSIHLIDMKPELYGSTSPKKMKKESLELYKEFTPDLIIEKLNLYLTQFSNQK
ncbi:glycosyltransferase family 9 protein [Aquimarina intermedia]|uniref:Heptosyltransferase-2 n=1 Tax=Aquimarina intermedia TaxID=350814 RepID=A0A5S5BWD5_9FLAO|nr:glycosyltransferase family 9 protein [Aquimarina intermedia]TYP70460.1 heptosyltransferase-2 [Aquimarina intermedia]